MNQAELLEGFIKLGVRPGMMLEVHTSLSSFGHVEGGAETVIAALMEAVTDTGTIFMPALRIAPSARLSVEDRALGITGKIKILPPDAPRSAMGIIADTFRRRSDVALGEGVFRIAAWGRHADEVKEGLSFPLKNGGKALLLGVDIYKLTAMHYVEELLPASVRRIFEPKNSRVRELYPEDEWHVECGRPPVQAWYTIQGIAYERGLIRDGMIGNCRAMFFDLASVVGLYRHELETRPEELYGLV